MGQRLDSRFSNLRVLLEDSYGKLLLGEDADSGTPVVVDLLALDGEPVPADEAAFRQQVSALIEVGLPALPVLVEADHGDDGYAVVWSHEGFIPLRMKLEKGEDISLAQAIDVTYQLADMLGSAGEDGHLHLDLSPNSVWVGDSGDGLAVRAYRYGVHHLFPKYAPGFRGSVFWGTAEYMAPELCSGKAPEVASDLYSVGILLVEMLTGAPPFRSANPRTTLKRQIYEKPLPLRLAKPDLPGVQKLDDILSGILAKSPAKRTESPQALKEQLEEFRAEFLPDFEWTLSGMDAAEDTASLGTNYQAPAREVAPTEEEEPEGDDDGVVTLVLGGAAGADAPEKADGGVDSQEEVTEVDRPAVEEKSQDDIATSVDIAAMDEPDEPEEEAAASAPDKAAVKTTTIQKPVPSEIIEMGVGSVGAPLVDDGIPGAGEPSEDLSEWFSQPADAIEPQEPSFHAHVKKDSHYFYYFVGVVALLLGVAMYFLMDRAPQAKKGKVTYMPVADLGGGGDDFARDDDFLGTDDKKAEDKEEVDEPETAEEPVEKVAGVEDEAESADTAGTDEEAEEAEAEEAEAEEAEAEEDEAEEDEAEEEGSDTELEAAEKLNEGGEADKNGDEAMEDGRYEDAVRFYEAALAAMPENANVGAKLLKAKGAQEAKQRQESLAAQKEDKKPERSAKRREELAEERAARKLEKARKAEERKLARAEAKEKRRLAREEAKEKRRLKAEARAEKKAEREAKKAAALDAKMAKKAAAAKKAEAAKKAALAKKAAPKIAAKTVAPDKETKSDSGKDEKAAAAKSALKKAVSAMKAKDYSGAKKAFKEAKSLGASEIIVNKYLKLIAKKLKK